MTTSKQQRDASSKPAGSGSGNFEEQAASAIAELAGRVASRYADSARTELETLREALKGAFQKIENALGAPPAPDEVGLPDCVQRLNSATEAYAQARSEQVGAEAQAILAAVQTELGQKTKREGELTAAIETLKKEVEKLTADLEGHKKQLGAAREDAARVSADFDAHKKQSASAHEDAARMGAELEAHKKTLAAAREDAAHMSAELEAHRKELTAARDDATRARIELEAHKTRLASAREDAASLSAERDAHKKELATARADAARMHAERDAELNAREKASAALEASHDKLRELEQRRAQAAAQLEAAAARLKTLETEHRDQKAELDAAVAREAEALARAEAAEQEREYLRTAETGSLTYEHAVAFLSLSFDRVLGMYQRFASGTSEEEVLEAIVAVMRAEFSRVVLFKVQPNAFEGVYQDGFNPAMDLSRLAIPRAMDSLLGRAASSYEVELLAGQELKDAGSAPFGGTPNVALAMPVGIDGEPLAVVYADDADQAHGELTSPELRIKFAELVRQQVTPFLTRIAAERKRLADLDEYAAVLLKHLQSTHAADVRALMSERERQQRLSQNLDYARRLYAQRAQGQGPRAAVLLDQRVSSLANAQPASVIGRDLATITEEAAPFAWSHAR